MADARRRFAKTQRLLTSSDYDRAFKRRRSQSDGLLVIYACENELPFTRLGIVASRKCGPAVTRNRWKRCIREAFRLVQHELPPGLDLVVLPRAGATPTTAGLQASLLKLTPRLLTQLTASQT